MVSFETSINDYAKSYQEFLTFITTAKVMAKGKRDAASLRAMWRNWEAAGRAAFKCNQIADRIGFKSLTADFNTMMSPEDAVSIFLHGEEKAVA